MREGREARRECKANFAGSVRQTMPAMVARVLLAGGEDRQHVPSLRSSPYGKSASGARFSGAHLRPQLRVLATALNPFGALAPLQPG